MKVKLVAATSINGKITRGDESDISAWTSSEDKDFFSSIRKESKLIVMGSRTYDVIRTNLDHINGRLRVVMTRNPDRYLNDTIPGSLEFTSENPKSLTERLSENYKEMLLVGGGVINGLFLKEKLVNEIYLTIEPHLFGTGKDLIWGLGSNIELKLIGSKILNIKGTILLNYSIAYVEGN